MPETRIGLNDSDTVSAEKLLPKDRGDYIPGDVDREKVYSAWIALLKIYKKEVPKDPIGLASWVEKYMLAGLKYVTEGKSKKGLAYAYFSTLLSLRLMILMADKAQEAAARSQLRFIERQLYENELLPKLPAI